MRHLLSAGTRKSSVCLRQRSLLTISLRPIPTRRLGAPSFEQQEPRRSSPTAPARTPPVLDLPLRTTGQQRRGIPLPSAVVLHSLRDDHPRAGSRPQLTRCCHGPEEEEVLHHHQGRPRHRGQDDRLGRRAGRGPGGVHVGAALIKALGGVSVLLEYLSGWLKQEGG